MNIKSITSMIRRPRAAESAGEQDASWYDAHFAATDAPRRHYAQSRYYFLWCVIADRIRRSGARRVLEIGCGPGQLAAFLLDQGVREYTGLDFSPKAIAIARQNAPAGRFVVGDARSPEIHGQVQHDALLCTEVLEHIEEDLQVVSRFTPGKRCYCSVPSFPFPSHVRNFGDAGEVAARYGPYFHDLDVLTLISPSCATDRFYLFEGVRNDRVAGGPGA
jgi:SAM-dependent methyltransferase